MRRLTIRERAEQIAKVKNYEFCGINFTLYNTDLVRIYDKVDGVCVFSDSLCTFYENAPKELADNEYRKEELIKLPKEEGRAPFAVCFYLEAPEKIEQPISARVNYR